MPRIFPWAYCVNNFFINHKQTIRVVAGKAVMIFARQQFFYYYIFKTCLPWGGLEDRIRLSKPTAEQHADCEALSFCLLLGQAKSESPKGPRRETIKKE